MTLTDDLIRLQQQGLYRSRRVLQSAQGVSVVVDGRQVINFCSNDYLGLANHPDVIKAFRSAAECYGVGSGSAHLICGHSVAHHALEEALANWTGRERALLFCNGYMANLGMISALLPPSALVLQDRLNHASLLDGGVLARARFKRYRHVDVADLSNKMPQSGSAMIVTDGVFSMDGDLAPLPQLADLAQQRQALLLVDDAHGLGVLGQSGGGCVEHFGLAAEQVPVLMGTLGKAFGTAGAFVAGSEAIIETLIQKARTYIYSTAMPAAIAEASRVSLSIVQTESWRRDKLRQLVDYFRQGAAQLGFVLGDSTAPIQPLILGDSQKTVAASDALLAQGFWVSAIRPPTVPQGQARLRVTFSAMHEMTQVAALLDALATL